MCMVDITKCTQASDPYDGILPVLEAKAERTRSQETEREAMKALETITGEATAPTTAFAQRAPQVGNYSFESGNWHGTEIPRPKFCQGCVTGLIRVIRNSDDTVRHVNGEKCKRFHS